MGRGMQIVGKVQIEKNERQRSSDAVRDPARETEAKMQRNTPIETYRTKRDTEKDRKAHRWG